MGLFGTGFQIMSSAANASYRASYLVGNAIFTRIQNARTKKEIQRIMQEVRAANMERRAVNVMNYVDRQQLLLTSDSNGEDDVYLLGPAEAPALNYIYGEDDELKSVAVSGGQDSERALALLPFIVKLNKAAIPIVAIHNGKDELTNVLTAYSGSSELVGRQGAVFDPFRGLPDNDVAEILFNTMPEGTPSSAQSLLRAIVRMCVLSNGSNSIQALADYPVRNMMSQLNQWHASGMVSNDEYAEISADCMSGSAESDSVHWFLAQLSRQATAVFGAGTTRSNLKKMIRSGGVEIFDIGDGTNDKILLLLLNYLLMIRETGKSFALLVEGISLSKYEQLLDLLSNGLFAISSPDLVSTLSGGSRPGADLFTKLLGDVGVTVLFRHTAPPSCKRWSEYIDTYKRLKMDYSIAQSNSYMASNDNRSVTVSESEEPRVRGDTISKLPKSMACIYRPQGVLIANVEQPPT